MYALSTPSQHPVISIVNSSGQLISPTGNNELPWLHEVDVFQSHANTNWAAPTYQNMLLYGGFNISTGAQNASIGWDIVLGAGTWAVGLMHFTGTNRGIYSVQLDSVEVGTIDGYAGSEIANVVGAATDIVVTTAGKKRLSLVMANKNASASTYYGIIQHIQVRRTA